jgi:di/tricarboxylate transporter
MLPFNAHDRSRRHDSLEDRSTAVALPSKVKRRRKAMEHVRKVGLVVVILLALFVAAVKPFGGLAPQGHYFFAVILVTLGLWIFRPPSLPYFAGGAFLLGGSLVFGMPLSTVACGYMSSAIWVLIPALVFGFALAKTGLGTRIAYFVLKTFDPSYLTIILSWFIIGLILSALTPSLTVRLAIVMPIAVNLVAACKLPDQSRGSALICLVAWTAAVLPGTGWQTGSLWGVFMPGFYPVEVRSLVIFSSWFQYMAVPWFIITVLLIILLYIFLKPKEPLAISQDIFQQQYADLGKIKRQEIITGVILVITLILFTTEKLHGISTPAVALAAFFALMIFRIITFPEVSTGVNWDIINFIAVAVGLTAVFVKGGITDWVRPFIEPHILSVAAYPLLFVLIVTLGLWLIRFIDIPWGFSTIALTAPLFVPLYQQFGLHPALVSVAITVAGNSFFLAYQQPFIMIAEAAMPKARGWSAAHVSLGGGLYALCAIAAILISSVYWKAAGLMP